MKRDNGLDQTARKLVEIQRALLPDMIEMLPPQELAARLAQQLANLPVNRRQAMRIRTALAVSDLEDLVDELSVQQADTRAELQRVYAHQAATAVYRTNIAQASKKQRRN